MIKLRRLSRRGTTWCYGGPDAAPVTTESGHGRRRARPPSRATDVAERDHLFGPRTSPIATT